MRHRTGAEASDAIHHVIARAVPRRVLFRDDTDRQRWMQLLVHTCAARHWGILAYCLLEAQLHLVVQAPATSLSEGMHWMRLHYQESFCRRHRTHGPVFDGARVAMRVQRDTYLLEVVRYVMLSPVRTGLSRDATAWPFGSARWLVNPHGPPPWMRPAGLYDLLGPRDGLEAARLLQLLGVSGSGRKTG